MPTAFDKPLKPGAFHVLLALADGDSYGYAIMQRVRDQSSGRVPLRTGSFYRHLGQLLASGLVVEVPSPEGVADSRRGTHYRLTEKGRRALIDERRHLEGVVSVLDRLDIHSEEGSR